MTLKHFENINLALRKSKITVPHLRILEELKNGNPALQLDIAKNQKISAPWTCQCVDRLEKYGAVTTTRQSDWGRKRVITITEKGLDILKLFTDMMK